MDALADALGDVAKYLVITGIVMFVAGFILDIAGVKGQGPEAPEKKGAVEVLREIILLAWKTLLDERKPPGIRVSAGGVLLICLGLLALVGSLIAGAIA